MNKINRRNMMQKTLVAGTVTGILSQAQGADNIGLKKEHSMNRKECVRLTLEAKKAKNLTFKQIAESIKRHVVWTTSALLGQQSMSLEEATTIVTLLGLSNEAKQSLMEFPMKGSLETFPPTDPMIYRLYEIMQVYGTTLKAIVNEEFGDGIMSAIDFTMAVDKIPNPAGDRVRVTMEGKFLPFKKW